PHQPAHLRADSVSERRRLEPRTLPARGRRDPHGLPHRLRRAGGPIRRGAHGPDPKPALRRRQTGGGLPPGHARGSRRGRTRGGRADPALTAYAASAPVASDRSVESVKPAASVPSAIAITSLASSTKCTVRSSSTPAGTSSRSGSFRRGKITSV